MSHKSRFTSHESQVTSRASHGAPGAHQGHTRGIPGAQSGTSGIHGASPAWPSTPILVLSLMWFTGLGIKYTRGTPKAHQEDKTVHQRFKVLCLTCVSEHGDLGVVLDVVHEGVAPAGDDQGR